MPAAARPRRQPTDDWQQLRLIVASPAQASYELLRPIVLFGQPPAERAHQTGVSERTLRRKVARFEATGMRSLFEPDDPPTADRRVLPLGIRKAIVELKAEYPPLSLREIAAICRARFDRAVSHHTVKQVLDAEPLPLHPPRRLPRYRDIPDPVRRRKVIVDLFAEGWSPTAIAGYLETTRTRVYETLARWETEGWPGLEDRSRAPHRPARKVDLKTMALIRRLQANPELGEFRIHAALAQLGIDLSPRACGRILALHRELGAPRLTTAPHEAQAMPFAAQRRHQYWLVDVRYVEDHALGTGKPAYAISILENFSRALLATAISPRQDLTAFLIVLRAAVEAHGAPEALVSDGGGIFRANQACAVYRALGIRKEEIERGQAWQNYGEPFTTTLTESNRVEVPAGIYAVFWQNPSGQETRIEVEVVAEETTVIRGSILRLPHGAGEIYLLKDQAGVVIWEDQIEFGDAVWVLPGIYRLDLQEVTGDAVLISMQVQTLPGAVTEVGVTTAP